MRRLAVLAPLAALAAGLLAWRRRRARTRGAPLAPAPDGAALPPVPRFASVPWTLVAAPDDRGELTVRCALPARMALDRVDAQETPTQVFVTALARPRADGEPDAADGEPDAADVREATVALSGPLGERELVHAPVDADASNGEPTGASLYP